MRVIDAWVNLEMPSRPAPWQRQAARQLFKKAPEEIFRSTSPAELIDMMDAAGVEKAVLTLHADRPSAKTLAFVRDYPDRFTCSLLLDPRGGMNAVRRMQEIVGDHPVVLCRVIPSLINVAPDDKIYYPLYAKCCELEMPVSVNTGIPGPPLPGRCQDPMCLDEVCLFFPELVVVMAHGADPWWEPAIRLMLKYPNLYLMTSAYAPRYLPSSLLHFMKTRGSGKVMFATDFPFLEMKRCVEEVQGLSLGPEVQDNYLYGNASRVLFGAS